MVAMHVNAPVVRNAFDVWVKTPMAVVVPLALLVKRAGDDDHAMVMPAPARAVPLVK
jgi:hypothetical protein